MHDAEGHPCTLNAAASYDFGGKRCQCWRELQQACSKNASLGRFRDLVLTRRRGVDFCRSISRLCASCAFVARREAFPGELVDETGVPTPKGKADVNKKRFTEEQIIAVLNEAEAGARQLVASRACAR